MRACMLPWCEVPCAGGPTSGVPCAGLLRPQAARAIQRRSLLTECCPFALALGRKPLHKYKNIRSLGFQQCCSGISHVLMQGKTTLLDPGSLGLLVTAVHAILPCLLRFYNL